MVRMPEIEPLSEARWARIEQSLMDRLDEMPSAERAPTESLAVPNRSRVSRVKAWPVALVATLAVSAAAAVAVQVGRPHANGATSRIVTEASASHVTIAENSLDVSPESGIEIREEDHATVLTLERGEVALHVAPREKDRPFLVEAGDVHVRVVGTEFTVRRVGIGAAVDVRRGVVEVREHGEVARLTAGEHWPSDPASATGTSPRGLAGSAASSTGVPNTPGTSPKGAAAAIEPASNANAVPAHAPEMANANATAPVVAARGAHGTHHHSIPSAAAPAMPPAAAPATAPAVAPATPIAGAMSSPPVAPTDDSPLPPAEPTPQSRYEEAAAVERADPGRALRLYLGLARGSDAWAQNALYAAGRLHADRGERADAARLLEEYLRRFPRGSNAQDARALLDSLR